MSSSNVFYSVSPGYITTFNATQYEFDVNVYSPVGTVVFESLLVVENINDLLIMIVNFEGSRHEFVPFSLNGMGDSVTFDVVKTNILLTITLDETLNPNDTTVEYNFTLQYFIAGFDISQSGSVNVLLYEVG